MLYLCKTRVQVLEMSPRERMKEEEKHMLLNHIRMWKKKYQKEGRTS
jgi:hypothetical protein